MSVCTCVYTQPVCVRQLKQMAVRGLFVSQTTESPLGVIHTLSGSSCLLFRKGPDQRI